MDTNKPNPFTPRENQKAIDWSRWKNEFMIYLKLIRAYEKYSEEERALLLLNLMGTVAFSAMEQIKFDDPNEMNDMDILLLKFDEIFNPPCNEIEERYKFFSTKKGKNNINEYVKDLQLIGRNCNFGKEIDKFIIDMLILNMDSNLRHMIFKLEDLSLSEVMEDFEQYDSYDKKLKDLSRDAANISMSNRNEITNADIKWISCWKCGNTHKFRSCPAYGKICSICREKDHFSGRCQGNFRVEKHRHACYKCGEHHEFRNCPAYDSTCANCSRRGHFSKVCKIKKEDLGDTKDLSTKQMTQSREFDQMQNANKTVYDLHQSKAPSCSTKDNAQMKPDSLNLNHSDLRNRNQMDPIQSDFVKVELPRKTQNNLNQSQTNDKMNQTRYNPQHPSPDKCTKKKKETECCIS